MCAKFDELKEFLDKFEKEIGTGMTGLSNITIWTIQKKIKSMDYQSDNASLREAGYS